MSDSRAKYEELKEQEGFLDLNTTQRTVHIIIELFAAAVKAGRG